MLGTIGLIAAMPQESGALLRYVKKWKRFRLGLFRAQGFKLSGWDCRLVTSGMGIRHASEAARVLVEMAAPQLLVSFGIAGAVEEDLKIGDVVMAEAVCQLDQGALNPPASLACLSAGAWEAAAQALAGRGARLFSGTAVTTRGSQIHKSQLGELVHPVLEMETAGIAQVAAGSGIPLIALRAISDGPCAPIPFNLGEIMDEDANLQTGKAVKAILRQPGIVLQIRRLMGNTRLAADNAAVALLAAMSQPAVVG